MHLFTTKLQPPVNSTTVPRPRLHARLDQGLGHPLTLVSAAAGFGKTTLVAAWLAESARNGQRTGIAWLALDEHDNEVSHFLDYLIAALQTIDMHIGAGLREALASSELEHMALLAALLNDVAALADDRPAPLVLVLDDYHVLENPQIDELLAFMVERLPPSLHLYILSRIDPALPLARLRARRRLVEIRERDLRFTPDEALAFFRDSMGVPISRAEVVALDARVEGWAAGLQLAALALQTADTASAEVLAQFAGTHRYIVDYLTDEVLRGQPAAVQQFLHETALLDRLCAPLCDAIRGRDDSRQMLLALERANLFILPLDQQRAWYRYHHLFADVLHQRLLQSGPALPALLHHRAALWYADYATSSGERPAVAAALRHGHATGDPALLAALLERFGDGMWERGELDQLRRWLGLLPATELNARPRLAVFVAWLDLTQGRYHQAEQMLLHANRSLADSRGASELHGRVAATRAFLATFRGDAEQTIQYANQALALLAGQSSGWRSNAAIALGDAYSLRGDQLNAEKAYAEALAISRAQHNLYVALNASFKFASTQRLRGRLHHALATCDQAIELAERGGLAQTALAGCIYALRGDVLCEWNRLPEALALTRQAVEAGANTQHAGFVGWIFLYRARCLLAARDLEGAAAVLRELDARAADGLLPPWLVSPVAALHAILHLAQGNLPAALAWVAERGLAASAQPVPTREFEYLVFARMLLAQRRFDAAQALFEQLAALSDRLQRAAVAIDARVGLALLHQAQGNMPGAVAALSEAVRLAEPGGFVRVFAGGGPALLPLLRSVADSGAVSSYIQLLLDTLQPAVPHETTPETLSERELAVLRLIAAGLKNQEIAGQLVISLNTVLYHTKNIYGKLGVDRRTQAVLRARELGLL